MKTNGRERNKRTNARIAAFVKENVSTLLEAVGLAERHGTIEGVKGSDKLDFASDWIADRIDIPLLPEWIEELVIKMLLTGIVEVAQHLWGKRDWFVKLSTANADVYHASKGTAAP